MNGHVFRTAGSHEQKVFNDTSVANVSMTETFEINVLYPSAYPNTGKLKCQMKPNA